MQLHLSLTYGKFTLKGHNVDESIFIVFAFLSYLKHFISSSLFEFIIKVHTQASSLLLGDIYFYNLFSMLMQVIVNIDCVEFIGLL